MIIQFSFAFSNELFNLYIFAALSELFPFWCPSFSFLFPNVLFNRSIFPVLPAFAAVGSPRQLMKCSLSTQDIIF